MAALDTKRNVLILAGVIGLVTSLLIVKAIGRTQPTMVVVATRDIPMEARITSDMLAIHKVADKSPDAITDSRQAVNLFAAKAIPAGAQIGRSDVKKDQTLASIIPPGMRAVTVAIDSVIGVAGFAKPGNYVDVVATFDYGERAITKTVIENAELLAVGRKVADENIKNEGGASGMGTEKATATLLLTPEKAEKVVLAENDGKLRLVLRAVGDDSIASPPGSERYKGSRRPSAEVTRTPTATPRVTGGGVIWKPTPKPPVPPADPGVRPITVYSGNERKDVWVPE